MNNISTKKFTIGIPVYNGESTLRETLECCIKLPYELVNIVVSDNNSSDRTYDIAEYYAKQYQNISLYRHEKNLGPGYNFKYLLECCKTEYFMWLAADDVIGESLELSEIELLFVQHPDAMAVSPFSIVGELGRQVADRGNRSLIGTPARNTMRFLMQPGVNSRFYSFYRTEPLRALFASLFDSKNDDYYGSDIVFSCALLRKSVWPMASSFILTRKPGISADGWNLRKKYSKSYIGAIFPSIKFIKKIVGMSPYLEKLPVLMVTSFLYLRYLIGPVRHRINKYVIRIKSRKN